MKPIPNFKSIKDVITPLMLCADTFGLILASSSAVWIRYLFDGKFHPILYAQLLPALVIFYAILSMNKLYPGILLNPPDELKRISQSITLGFLLLAAIVFLSKHSHRYSRGIFLMAWGMSLITVPLLRALVKRAALRIGVWGRPTIILGAGETGKAVVRTLVENPLLGLKPAAFLDDDPLKKGMKYEETPVAGSLDSAPALADTYNAAIAILAFPSIDRSRLQTIIDNYTDKFSRVILIPDLFGITNLWVSTSDLAGILGLDIRHKLLDPRRQVIKRFVELFLILSTLPASTLLMCLIAAAVKLDSKGPVLFKHSRIGFGGKDITIWKFRTMVQDAEDRLQECLKDPKLFELWAKQQKLPDDPRITRLGRFLRATSLDELPQLFNVIRGDLSLVGPRPIVWAEVEKYENGFRLYKKVRPGLTGLWQISGRSETSYEHRVELDKYYVRNWSVWMDIYILIKTPMAVLCRKGAY
jgi:Undecaprenyl-phosphate galactose phosphotransferase WbaP